MTSRFTSFASRSFALSTVVLATFLASPLLAHAADQAASTERHDVRTVCRDIGSALQSSVGRMWSREVPVGTMKVQFQLRGTQVDEINLKWMHEARFAETRRTVRNAMRSLKCSSNASEAQQFSFLLELREPADEKTGTQNVALLER